jgi:hypothetical protein
MEIKCVNLSIIQGMHSILYATRCQVECSRLTSHAATYNISYSQLASLWILLRLGYQNLLSSDVSGGIVDRHLARTHN